jgi:hypothetical protein
VEFPDFLARVHERLQPDTYLEIGLRNGRSLALARCASVAIDPAMDLTYEIDPAASLFSETSDEHFAKRDVLEPFGGRPISLALIDGMHLIEYVLRDFINVEKHALWSSVVVVDDVLPRRSTEATRERASRFRARSGEHGAFRALRADRAAPSRASPRGAPRGVLGRRGVLDPERVLSASFWSVVRDARERRTPREEGVAQLRASLERDLGWLSPRAGRWHPWRRRTAPSR